MFSDHIFNDILKSNENGKLEMLAEDLKMEALKQAQNAEDQAKLAKQMASNEIKAENEVRKLKYF